MVATILFVGLGGTNSGKTTVAAALLRALRAHGRRAVPWKPFGGSNAWTDSRDVLHSLRAGRFFGHDSETLRRAAASSLREELIGPVHRLWAAPPHDHRQATDRPPTFVLDRVTRSADPGEDLVVVNATLPFDHGLRDALAPLLRGPAETLAVETLDDLNRIQREHYESSIRSSAALVYEHADVVVCESFGGACLPWRELTALALVVAVHPGYFCSYAGAEYQAEAQKRLLPEPQLRTLLQQSGIPWEHSGNLLCFFEAKAVCAALAPASKVEVPILATEELDAHLDRAMGAILESLGFD